TRSASFSKKSSGSPMRRPVLAPRVALLAGAAASVFFDSNARLMVLAPSRWPVLVRRQTYARPLVPDRGPFVPAVKLACDASLPTPRAWQGQPTRVTIPFVIPRLELFGRRLRALSK